jgi:hypothetical protein
VPAPDSGGPGPLLYAVEFEIIRRAGRSASSPYAFALADAARWVAAHAMAIGTKPDFRVAGRCDLRPGTEGHSSWASWEPIRDGALRAVQLEVVADNTSSIHTKVDIRELAGQASIAISLWSGQSQPEPALSRMVDGGRPEILRYLLDDPRIALRVGDQDQDGLYATVRSPPAVVALAEDLRDPQRLPTALFHTRTLAALASARHAAARLVGLARVVTLDLRATQQLEDLLPDCAPPYASARLLWSNPEAPSLVIDSDVVNGAPPDAGAQLMRWLAPGRSG